MYKSFESLRARGKGARENRAHVEAVTLRRRLLARTVFGLGAVGRETRLVDAAKTSGSPRTVQEHRMLRDCRIVLIAWARRFG